MGTDVIARLAAVIVARRGADGDKSYTRRLLDGGVDQCARKFGEEAIETLMAGLRGDKTELTSEAADLVYHLIVLLTSREISWSDVESKLETRMGISGIDEKASRKVADALSK